MATSRKEINEFSLTKTSPGQGGDVYAVDEDIGGGLFKTKKVPVGSMHPVTVETVAQLRAMRVPGNVRYTVRLLGYYSKGDGGGGPNLDWVYGASPGTYVDDGGSVFVPSGGDGSRAWVRSFIESVNIRWFGAKNDALFDSFPFIQSAADTGCSLIIPLGDFMISEPIQLNPGQNVRGSRAGNFVTGQSSKFTCPSVGGGIFWYTQDTDIDQKKMPIIECISMVADYPIRFNNESTAVISDLSGNVPFGMKPQIKNCDMTARSGGVGIGISWSKMFDGIIESCDITSFDVNVLLNGCDICSIRDNRIANAKTNHILEVSTGTFGSQNEIVHNDILHAQVSTTIFIKSSSRHVRIYDNYLESTTACKGFIDITSYQTPSLTISTPALTFTAIIKENRIDGMAFASTFVYRITPSGTFWELSDGYTTGTDPSNGFVVIDSSGSNTYLPIIYQVDNLKKVGYFIHGYVFGEYSGLRTSLYGAPNLNRDTISVCNLLFADLGLNYFKIDGSKLLFLNGFTHILNLSNLVSLGFFNESTNYRIKIRARTPAVSGVELLSLYRYVGSGAFLVGGTLLTKNMSDSVFEMQTPASFSGVSSWGVGLGRTNNGNDIQIESIEITEIDKVYDVIASGTDTCASTFYVTHLTGSFQVRLSETTGGTFTYKYLKFIHGQLLAIKETDIAPGIMDFSFSVSGTEITFTSSGSATAKRILTRYRQDE